MTRLFTVTAVVVLLVLGLWLYRGCTSPEARIARPYAQEFEHLLRKDARFAKVEVGIWERGSKGPVYVRGRVPSESDAADLRLMFNTLGCPVGVSWQVVADTNLSGGAR